MRIEHLSVAQVLCSGCNVPTKILFENLYVLCSGDPQCYLDMGHSCQVSKFSEVSNTLNL